MDRIKFIKEIVNSKTREGVYLPPRDLGNERTKESVRIIRWEDGRIRKIYIHQSMVKRMFSKGTRLDYCPKNILEVEIMRNYRKAPTQAMTLGLYLENGLLNEGRERFGEKLNLPKGKNGKKSVLVDRVDEQILMMKQHVFPNTGIIVVPPDKPKSNVWRKYTIKYEDEYLHKEFDVEIYIELEVDLISPFSYSDGKGSKLEYPVAIIDIKLAGDRYESRGEYCWGRPEEMDHFQAYTYSFGLNLPFMYLVVDYKKENKGWRPIPVNTDINNPVPIRQHEAKLRLKEWHQTIRSVVSEIIHNERTGWPKHNDPANCRFCPILNCPDRNKISII